MEIKYAIQIHKYQQFHCFKVVYILTEKRPKYLNIIIIIFFTWHS